MLIIINIIYILISIDIVSKNNRENIKNNKIDHKIDHKNKPTIKNDNNGIKDKKHIGNNSKKHNGNKIDQKKHNKNHKTTTYNTNPFNTVTPINVYYYSSTGQL
jgi:hypothetical protein